MQVKSSSADSSSESKVPVCGGSKVFRRNRVLGYVSNKIPAIIRYVRRRRDTLIITCIGRSFQVYTASHFRLLHVSDTHPDEITAMAFDFMHFYTASNKCIFAWRSGKHIRHVYRGHDADVHILLPFGRHLVAVDGTNVLKVWNIESEEVYLEIPFMTDDFLITALAHPPTYLNKILIGSEKGQLRLWNIKDNRCIYTFEGYPSKVTCIQPAPALDTVGVGHYDGTITLINLKFNEQLMEFKQDWGQVTQITFRTDGIPIMAVASQNGNIAFWNLEERKIGSQIQAHEEAVTTAICFPNEPLLLTTSPDNSVKLWIFDTPDGGVRLLRIREGHTAPPLCIRYHGSGGHSILSAGEDSSLRVFSTISATLNKSMGKASYDRKRSKKKGRFEEDTLIMPPIVEFTTETTREKEWDNIAAIHKGIIQTTTWSFDKNRMGEHRLVPPKFQNKNRTDFTTETTCLILTHCGNFVIIGYSNGDVERFNIQSGIHRCSYGNPAHKASVRGVFVDNLNQFVVTGCSAGLLKFWNFKDNLKPSQASIDLTEGITLMRGHREGALVGVVLANFVISVVDTDARTVVRKFEGHVAKIHDITFSPDCRWLITAAMDLTIKVWDIPSSYMIDHFKTERPCVSLSMSPSGDFLATAHVNSLGIYLWANKMLFNQITLRSINPFSEAPYIDLPTSVKDGVSLETALQDMSMHLDDQSSWEGDEINQSYKSPIQLSTDLITMSGLAASRWQNLLDLDIIKKRNKPKAPPQVPKQAPFFLPTVAGTEFKWDLCAPTADAEGPRVLRLTTFSNLTKLGQLLEMTAKNNDFEECINYLKELGPSMIDFEVKSLHPFSGGTILAMQQFLHLIAYMFSTNINFELCQSYLSVFLRAHGFNIIEQSEIMDVLKVVSDAQKKSWQRLEKKFLYGIGVVAALRNFAH